VNYDQFTGNKILTSSSVAQAFWDNNYNLVHGCNSIIKYAGASTGMSDTYKKQFINEAKFVRAFCYFHLVNLFGEVPLVLETDVTKTAYLPRTAVADVYAQIKTDLLDARNNLPADYVIAGNSRIRANKWAATALLARVYLYTGDYTNAEAMATELINYTSLYALLPSTSIASVFKKNQTESILEWNATGNYVNTAEGTDFLLYYNRSKLIFYPFRSDFLNSFETGDLRKTNWTFTYNTFTTAYKYKRTTSDATNDEDLVVLRLPEQYLIRAEARAQQNNIDSARADINKIRNRAGLGNVATIVDKSTTMTAIENERRHELFCEWGHRWFDLKRWPSLTTSGKTRADDVLGALKTTWTSTAVLYPIPDNPRIANPNLTQNDGY
jgi:hypothetical protein